MKQRKDFLFHMQGVAKVPKEFVNEDYRLILQSESLDTSNQQFQELVAKTNGEIVDYELTLTHKHCKLVDIHKNILP